MYHFPLLCCVASIACLCSPCVRCLKPFTPSAEDLREAAGYQPVSTQPGQYQPTAAAGAQPRTAATEADTGDDNTDWEEFEDFDQEQERLEKGQQPAADSSSTQPAADAVSSSRLSSTPNSTLSSASASSSSSPTHSSGLSGSHGGATPPDSHRPRLNSSLPVPPRPSPPPAIDFFGSVGIASSGYQEPVRLQSKLKPQSTTPPQPSPVLTAWQRAEVLRDYGLDDVGVDAASWDDGLELDDTAAVDGGKGREDGGRVKKGRNGEKKKRGLGAVVVDDV